MTSDMILSALYGMRCSNRKILYTLYTLYVVGAGVAHLKVLKGVMYF
jgi:hypothetical protein